MFIGERKEGYLEETLYQPFDPVAKEENEINKANAALLFRPEFIPYYPSIALEYELTLLQTLLYGFIRFYLWNASNEFYFTNSQLGELFNVAEGTIANNMKGLKDKGLIKPSYKFKSDGGKVRFIRSHAILRQVFTKSLTPSSRNSEYNNNNINKKEHIEQNTKNKTPTSNNLKRLELHIEDSEMITNFDQFWSAYPVKKSKSKAKMIYMKLVGNDPSLSQAILDAIEAQKKEREANKMAGKFVPEWKHPTTWLNQGCWEDEVTYTEQHAESVHYL